MLGGGRIEECTAPAGKKLLLEGHGFNRGTGENRVDELFRGTIAVTRDVVADRFRRNVDSTIVGYEDVPGGSARKHSISED